MASDEVAWSDFGQKVDLCVRLRDVLVNYPEGALLKEMTQNADDAGASTFKVVLDLRSHDSRSLSFPGTAEFQGPALLTYNDAVFTDTDLESIQNVGASRKTDAEARAKTGRFGVGFCSCYHVTDLPSFLSRKFLVILDPHCRSLPNANANEARPGFCSARPPARHLARPPPCAVAKRASPRWTAGQDGQLFEPRLGRQVRRPVCAVPRLWLRHAQRV